VDGAKLGMAFGGVDLTLFAVKNDNNEFLANGLTGQPNNNIGTFNTLGGFAVGGLTAPIDQTAGARITFGGPLKAQIGATFYQAWSSDMQAMDLGHDQARVFGGDISVPFMKRFSFDGSYTRSDALQAKNSGLGDITDDNVAWDAKIAAGFGKLDIGVGYKDIGHNFDAAGSWDKIGQWTNPVNVKGPYADISYPLMHKVKLVLNGEYLTVKDSGDVTGNFIEIVSVG
jgi:hypothetical protein